MLTSTATATRNTAITFLDGRVIPCSALSMLVAQMPSARSLRRKALRKRCGALSRRTSPSPWMDVSFFSLERCKNQGDVFINWKQGSRKSQEMSCNGRIGRCGVELPKREVRGTVRGGGAGRRQQGLWKMRGRDVL